MDTRRYINSTHNENCKQVFVETKDPVSLLRDFFSDAEDAQFEEVRPDEDINPLIRFILDDNERNKVTKGLQLCTDAGQVAEFAKVIYTEEILTAEVLRSVNFHRAIIPLLKFETTEAAIKQAIQKRVG